MDGLEKRLKDEKKSDTPNDDAAAGSVTAEINNDEPNSKRPHLDNIAPDESAVYSPASIRSVR